MWKNNRKSGNNRNDSDMERLALALGRVSGELCLDEADRVDMKKCIIGIIRDNDFAELENGVCRVGRQIELSNKQKKILWEDIVERMEWGWKAKFLSFPIVRHWRKCLSSFLVLLVAFGMFIADPLELRMTRASKWTYLEKVEGQVYVNREGRVLVADTSFALKEGDLIVTSHDSFVTIRFLDDSVTRLGADTSLQIGALRTNPDNRVNTEIELILVSGRIWATVSNLIDNNSVFSVENDYVRANVNSRASFEMSSVDTVTKLAVFDNMVDLSKKNVAVPSTQTVVAGFEAELNSRSEVAALSEPEILVKKTKSGDLNWVEKNLALDKQHLISLETENKKFIKDSLISNQTFEPLADFCDMTKALFANADIENARRRFLDVHLGFIKAQEYLLKAEFGNDYRHKATPLLIQYKVAIAEINANRDFLFSVDEKQAESLFRMMKEEVDLQRKALNLVLPDDSLYTAKQVVMEAAGYFAITSPEKAMYLLGRSRNRLLEVKSLISKNNLQGAEAAFRSYLSGLNELVSEVKSSEIYEIEMYLFALFDEQIRQVKLLTAIESELISKNDERLSKVVSSVKNASLRKLIEVIVSYRKNAFSLKTLLELKNIVSELPSDLPDKLYYTDELDKVLLMYPKYLNKVKQKNENLDKSGMKDGEDVDGKPIKDIEATPELSGVFSGEVEEGF